MAIFAIADLHLGHAVDKPMDIFGSVWDNHPERLREAWERTITEEDTVLLPGDLSWAMTLDQARPDLDWIGRLPGRKVLIRGNHDYWWSGIGKVRRALPPSCWAIQNDAVSIGDWTVCGTRGWLLPDHPHFTEQDMHIYQREGERLRLSLQQAAKSNLPIIVAMHFPPLPKDGTETIFTKLLEEYEVDLCVYGHLHGPSHRLAFEGVRNGIEYRLVSADYLDFQPVRLR